MTGLLMPISGSIALERRPLASSVRQRSLADRRAIQIVPQSLDTTLNPRHRISDIIGRPLTFYQGMVGRERTDRVMQALDQVELGAELADRYPRDLLGGQRQRVAIAHALIARPNVLVCDEPTSALDALVARDVIRLLQRAQADDGIACLFITHDLTLVRAIASRTALLQHGRIKRTEATRT